MQQLSSVFGLTLQAAHLRLKMSFFFCSCGTAAERTFMNALTVSEALFVYRKKVISPAVFTDDSAAVVEPRYVASMNQNLSARGFTMSAHLLGEVGKLSYKSSMQYYKLLMATIDAEVGADRAWQPIWPNFPTDVAAASAAEQYLVNLLHYLSNRELSPAYDASNVLPELIDFSSLAVINAGDNTEFIDVFVGLLTQNTPLSDSDRNFLRIALSDAETAAAIFAAMSGKRIPQHETAAIYACAVIKSGSDEDVESLYGLFRTPTDVLRLAAKMSDGDESLATPVRFRSFSRNERRLLLSLLNDMKELPSKMVKYREEWKRLGEKLHPSEYTKLYPHVAAAFAVLRSSEHIESFEGHVDRLLRSGDYVAAAELMKQRPGMLARSMDLLLRSANDCGAIIAAFGTVAEHVDTRVLFQLYNHFCNRNVSFKLATGRKNGASTHVADNAAEPIEKSVLEDVMEVCKQGIAAHYRANGPVGKIYVSSDASRIACPTNVRHTKRALFSAATGSSFDIPKETKALRAFLYWNTKNPEDVYRGEGTDLDLAAMFVRGDNSLSRIGYFNLTPDIRCDAYHSGDVRSCSQNGACEFIDFNLDKAERAGCKYVAFTCNSYSGQPFSELADCFIGWMARDGETGKAFEPRTVKNRLDLTSDSRESVLFIVDVIARKVIVADVSLASDTGGNLYYDSAAVFGVVKSIVETQVLTVADAAALMALGGNELTENPEEADILITDEDVRMKDGAKKVSCYDLSSLANLLL